MTIFSTADETRRQARESKEKGVPANRDELAKIEGETGYYIDTFSETPSDSSTGGSTGGSGQTTTNTQENEPNETAGGDSATGGSSGSGGGTTKTTFDPDAPVSMAQPEGVTTNADSLEDTDSAPTNGEPCIGCDVDKLDGMTEGTCAEATGDCVKIHYDGIFPTPEGWADPETAPAYNSWEDGFYWYSAAYFYPGGYNYQTYGESAPTIEQVGAAVSSGVVDYGWKSCVVTSITDIAGIDPNNLRRVNYKITNQSGVSSNRYNDVVKVSCTTQGADLCPDSAPLENGGFWPQDECYDLIFDGVAFKGSDLDPDLPDKYKGAGTSKVDYCTGGGADGSTSAGVDAGFQIHTTDMMRYYDSDGNLKAAGDKTQTFIDQYKP